MRAVAYNDAVQTVILIYRLGPADDLRTVHTGRLARTAPTLRLRHVQPLEAAHPARCRGHLGAGAGKRRGGKHRPRGLVLQQQLPLAGHGHLCADHRPVVLVHRPIYRAAGPGRAERADGPPGQHLRRLPEALPRVPVHHSGFDLLRPGQERQGAGPERGPVPGGRPVDSARRPAGLPAHGASLVAGRIAWHRGGRAAFGA